MKYKKLYFIAVLFNIVFSNIYAQKDSVVLTDKILNNIDTLRFAKVSFGAFKISPYIAPVYSPETSWMLSGGGLISFKVQKHDTKLNYSSVPFSFGYSITGAIDVVVDHEVFWVNDRFRLIGNFQVKDRPDNYWGVGYENGISVDKNDSLTGYHRKYFRFKERVMYNLGNSLFIGPIIDYSYTQADDMNSRMEQDPHVLSQGTEFMPLGLGVAFEHDSRDFPSNAYDGWYLGGNIMFFKDWFRSEAQYFNVEITYMQYKKIMRERSTLAWRLKTIYTSGAFIPWTNMAMIGGKDDLRGYTLGRFRDKQLIDGIVEYRYMFKRKRLNKQGNYNSRWGFVVWVGAGSVAPKIIELSHWLPNGGLGARFEIHDRMNIRVDGGIGKKEHGFYITFKEAF